MWRKKKKKKGILSHLITQGIVSQGNHFEPILRLIFFIFIGMELQS
jgi:hypothetical protein